MYSPEEQQYLADIHTTTSSIFSAFGTTPVPVLVPACMTVILNCVLAAPEGEAAQALVSSIKNMVPYLEDQAQLRFASAASDSVH